MNLYANQGVAVREFIMATGHGRADYLLFVDQKAVGAIEAKWSSRGLTDIESEAIVVALERSPNAPSASAGVPSTRCRACPVA